MDWSGEVCRQSLASVHRLLSALLDWLLLLLLLLLLLFVLHFKRTFFFQEMVLDKEGKDKDKVHPRFLVYDIIKFQVCI